MISFTVSVPRAGEMLGPGDHEIVLNLTLVVLVDEAWIFTFREGVREMGTFHHALTPMRPTGHGALARPATP